MLLLEHPHRGANTSADVLARSHSTTSQRSWTFSSLHEQEHSTLTEELNTLADVTMSSN